MSLVGSNPSASAETKEENMKIKKDLPPEDSGNLLWIILNVLMGVTPKNRTRRDSE